MNSTSAASSFFISQVALRKICSPPLCIGSAFMALGCGRLFSPQAVNPQPLLATPWSSIALLGHFWSMGVTGLPLSGIHIFSCDVRLKNILRRIQRMNENKIQHLHGQIWLKVHVSFNLIISFYPCFYRRFSVRVNNTDVFHVDKRFWTSFRSRFPATGPRERAFHSATIIGNYMVVYGEQSDTWN